MINKVTLLLFLSANIAIYSQSILKKYESDYTKYNEQVAENPETAKKILMKIEKTVDYKKNDSLKVLNFLSLGTYYYTKNDNENAFSEYQKCANLAESIKLYSKASSCYHNMAQVMNNKNKIDSAISLDKKAIVFAKKSNSLREENIATISISRKLAYQGKFKESNQLLFGQINKIHSNDFETKGTAFANIANNYDQLGINSFCEKYYQKANYNYKKSGNTTLIWKNLANLTDFYNTKKNYSKALVYADSILFYSKSDNAAIFHHMHKSNAYKGLKNWDKAIYHINQTLELDKKLQDNYGFATDLLSKGQIYLEKQDFSKAIPILKQSKKMFLEEQVEDKVLEKQLYRDLVMSFLKVNNREIASDYEKFLSINDSLSSQSSDKNVVELESKYNKAENELKIKSQNLLIEKEKYNRNLALGGIALLGLLSAGGFLWNRNLQKRRNLERENQLMHLKQNLGQMELEILNKQLDPHEFKNLLMGISPEIREKAPEAYRNMVKLLNITKASINNKSMTENLETQIQQVSDYLELEKKIMNKPLHFEIQNSVHKKVEIPRLLLKNLVENAVKHGIKPKNEIGEIRVNIFEKNKFLYIEVDDTGIGRKQAISKDSGTGTSTYQNLFGILNQKNTEKADFQIIDKESGTKVEVKIPLNYQYS